MGRGEDLREEDVQTEVKLSSNDSITLSTESTLLSFLLTVGSPATIDRLTEDNEVTPGGKLVVVSREVVLHGQGKMVESWRGKRMKVDTKSLGGGWLGW